MTTSVYVNVSSYSTTHVAANMLRGLKRIIQGCGLDVRKLADHWGVLEAGVATWLGSQHLRALTLEVYDPRDRVDDRRGRFDFIIDYGYYSNGEGELWIDEDTVRWVINKNGSYPELCDYRILADTAPGRPYVPGWSSTTARSTDGMARHMVGTAVGGGSIGAQLAYYTRR